MKLVRSLIALSLSAALVLLSPGSRAWAQAAEAATSASASSAGVGAVGGVHGLPGSVAMPTGATLVPVFGLSVPAASLSAPASFAAPSAAASAVPALAASAASASAVAPSAAASAQTPTAAAALSAPAIGEYASVSRDLGPARAPASAPLATSVRELGPALGPTAVSGVGTLNRLFDGARRVFGLQSAPAVDGSSSHSAAAAAAAASAAPALAPSAPRSAPAAEAAVPAPRSAARAAAAPAAGLAAAFGVAAFGASVAQPLIALGLVIVSLILHEIGHAKVAAALGDPTATRAGRASFNPLKWGSHVDPLWTIVLPIVTYFSGGFIFGGAKPIPMEPYRFKNPVRGMALVALAGPAVNLVLAGAGALAYAGAVGIGFGGVALGVLTTFVYVNVLLALFNLVPVRPLDGGHVLAALLPPAVSARLDSLYDRLGSLRMLPAIVVVLAAGGVLVTAAAVLTHLLIGMSIAATGVQLATASLPAVAALGLAMGSLGAPPSGVTPAAAAPRPGAATLVVVFDRSKPGAITKDVHLAALDARRSDYALTYQRAYGALMADVSALGVAPETLATYNASPVASYRRINAATFTLDAGKAEEFTAMLRAQGHQVYANDRRKIITPVPFHPEDADPTSRNAVGMAENLKITRADSVQAIGRRRWGAPNMTPWQKALKALTGDQPAQPKVGVVDSGADTSHPLLQRVKQVQNFTTDPNVDDIGHGSWVTSLVLNYAPWLNNLTHYKTFSNGGATLDDILKALTAAANDGNIVISNSWGSDDGDPESPDSKLVAQLAQEGHILVFAAGNAGPGANTVGSPAIMQFKDPTTGAIRVVAVAATDRNKKVASFSSVGPGSPKTVGQTGFAHRPDLASDGVNAEGAWPAALNDADRTDPVAGPLKAISGTSMSTPTVAGAIVLLAMMFGVTAIGPKLDAVVVALTSTLQKTGKNDVDHEGDGFIDVQAAYDALVRQFGDPAASNGFVARLVGRGPSPAYVAEYRSLLLQVEADDESERSYRLALNDGHKSAGVRDELLEHFENFIEPEHAARRARLAALIKTHPNVEYEASSPLRRLWLRVTGRGPGN